MKRILSIWILTMATATSTAEEGMFPISEIARLDLPSKGLEIAAEDIFSADKTCLIDGICKVNGCTGSFISDQGLIITNHHCAYRAIQSLSSKDRDLLRDGFSSATLGDELYAKGYTVRITESYEDVSSRVLKAVNDSMDFVERTKAIERRQKELEKEAEEKHAGKRAEVAEMFQGKTYVLFLYTYIKDVRLVFAPPSSVGNFGGDIDNWEWPRHTGDFSFMRAYVAPDGSTAEYSEDNVPYKPKRFIQVAVQGAQEGDFVFLLGYPGRTARHKTGSFLEYEQRTRLPAVVELYQWQIGVMDEAGKEDRAVALKHSSRSKSLANVEKRSRGQLKGLDQKPLIQQRLDREAELQKFIEADPSRQEKYGLSISKIEEVYREMTDSFPFEFNFEHLRQAPRAMALAFTIYDAAHERQKEDLERESAYMNRNMDLTAKRLMLTVRDFHAKTDHKILMGMLERLAEVPAAKEVQALAEPLSGLDEMSAHLAELYSQTRLGNAEFVESCLTKTPAELDATDEPFFEVMKQLYPDYLKLREKDKERDGKLDQLYGNLLEVKREFEAEKFVPDANATLRLTHGRVEGYSPEDGITKTPITTLSGVIAKTTGIEPFVTPKRIRELHSKRDFGKFAHPDLDDVPVAILYSTDTTGGNSGSPIINARGELVGVNFDRAFEATINDFAWHESYSRSIGVDIRYALWITGTVFKADRLLSEMNVSDN